MSADGAKINKKVAEELNLELDLCYFHENGQFHETYQRANQRFKSKNRKKKKNIEENIEKIDEIKELRKGIIGHIKKDDKKANIIS